MRRIELELEQSAQRHVPARLIVDQLRVFLVRLIVVRARRMLQLRDRIRRPHMLLATHAPLILAARVELSGKHRIVGERRAMRAHRFFHHLEQADTADIARSAAEILLDELLRKPHRLEDLGTAVRHIGADAHFGHHLVQSLADRLDVVGNRLVGIGPVQVRQRLKCEVRMHRLRPVAGEQCEVMYFARRACFDDQARCRCADPPRSDADARHWWRATPESPRARRRALDR